MIITRHGGEAHYVRPDRVMRTGVLASIFGYQPGADVQRVAQAFTQGPPSGTIYASGSTTMLGGFGAPGPIARFFSRIKAAWNAPKARAFMMNGAEDPRGPAFREAQMVAPQLAMQMKMLARLAPMSGGGPMAAAHSAATRRWNTYYTAG